MEMDESSLSVGAIREIRTSNEVCVENPIFQCLSTKQVGEAPAARHRAILSDSETFIQSMFSTSLNDMVENGEIPKNCFVKLTNYMVQNVKERVIIVVHELEVVGICGHKIGNPAAIEAYIAAQLEQAPSSDAAENNNNGNANPYQANAVAVRNGNNARGGANAGGGGARNAPARGGNNNNARNNSAASGSGQSHPIYPIEGLSPYQNKWTIKARVTNKSDIRHWSNQRGEGKLFSCTLLDESGEIKMTGFNDAVDSFYTLLEEGKVYFVSKAKIQIAKKQFSNVNNEYEITLESQSEISLCTDTENVPQVKFEFVELGNLESVEPNSTCDVIGVIKEVGEISQIISKASQKPITKRELVLVDSSEKQVRLTLWGRQAENFNAAGEDGTQNPVIAFKGVKVGDFGGRSLSMVGSSSMVTDPDIEEAHALRGWYDDTGANANFSAYTSMGGAGGANGGGNMKPENFRNIGDAKDSLLGGQEEPDFFCVRATLTYVKKDNFAYPACPTCNKKLLLEDTDSWRCEKCEKAYPAPTYRYVLTGQVADFTGYLYISGFDEVGNLLIGSSADNLERVKSEDEAQFNGIIDRAMGKYWNLSIKARSESYNDQQKIRYQVLKAVPASWEGEPAKRLMDMIASYD